MGKKFLQKLNDENDEYYNFISVIAPSLYSFLYQVEICVLSNIGFDKLNWILCIDSMTLKFEGALRSFIKLQGSSTLTTKQKKRSKTNDTDIREQTLDELINSKIIKSNFSDNEIALFKMVFTENGANIRNNVAHGFYHYENYSFSKALKVFLCIMRLGKYKMIKKS